jgi:translation initiation factor 1
MADNPGQEKKWKFTAKLRIEKNGRRGKTVTVIDGLPKSMTFLDEITREIKTGCGTGGTFLTDGKDGVIEIQGDKRDQIRKIFEGKGFNVKG